MKFQPEYEDAMHATAFIIVAFNDNVGIACDKECAERVIDDLVADHEDADAGMEPATDQQVRIHKYCMSCGQEVDR